MPTTIAAPKTKTVSSAEEDFLPLQGTDYVEFYVGNAKQAAHFYKTAFGFQSLAYSGPETGTKDRASYAIRQNKITFVLTTPLRPNHHGPFMPGFRKWKSNYNPPEVGLQHVDHCVGNVGWNQMNPWVKFYEDVMGFRNILTFDDKDISTEYSALMSKVMSNGNGFVKFPINEPAEGKKKSQVEEYLDFYNGEGVQHCALATNNIIETVTDLHTRGVEFLKIPGAYYDTVLDRVG